MDERIILNPENALIPDVIARNRENNFIANHLFYDVSTGYPSSDKEHMSTEEEQEHVVFSIKMSNNKSLVKYNLPHPAPYYSNTNSLQSDSSSKNIQSNRSTPKTGGTISGRIRKSNFLPPIDGSNVSVNEDIQEILNSVLSPKCWRDAETDEYWMQEASTTPSTRIDVFNLQRHLDDELEARNAKEFGLCPVRRQLYNQAFDELIRQLTVNCSERGLMLARIRDEIRLTLNTYQCLYESAVGYGLRKAVVAEQVQTDTEVNLEEMQKHHADYTMKIDELKDKLAEGERLHMEEKMLMEKKMNDENGKLTKTNNQLKRRKKKPHLCELGLGDESPRIHHQGTRLCSGSPLLSVLLELIPCAVVMLACTLCVVMLLNKLG